MKKRLILVGKSAAGKDYARKICQQWLGLKYQVSYTTRPPRQDEQEGHDYFFVPMRTFNKMINEDKWYEYVTFNGWNYGTTKEQFYTEGSVLIMTPHGLSKVSVEDRKESLVLYLDIPLEYRKNRMEARVGNADSVQRRLEADHIDFHGFEDYDAVITNPHYSIVDIYRAVEEWMPLPLVDKILLEK
jgi:guanylate kinase